MQKVIEHKIVMFYFT